ncbi:MAG: PEGA domain-containing protein [Gemmataceae bacterium]
MPMIRTIRNALIFTAVTTVTCLTGCIDRRFVIETNVPGAQVFVNNRPIGPSPADTGWEYPGMYEFRVISPGYEPLTQCRYIKAKWYDYAPFDFMFGVLWPFHIEDIRRLQFELTPARQVNPNEVEARAEDLRNRVNQLPPPTVPDDVKK